MCVVFVFNSALGDRLLPPGELPLFSELLLCVEFGDLWYRFRRAYCSLALWLLNANAAREPLLYPPESLAPGLFYFARGPARKSPRRHESRELKGSSPSGETFDWVAEFIRHE